jgi:hypothetical protein
MVVLRNGIGERFVHAAMMRAQLRRYAPLDIRGMPNLVLGL